AVGTTARHVGFATERHAPGAAVTALHVALRHVDEPGHPQQDTDIYDPVMSEARPGRPFRAGTMHRSVLALLALSLLAACSSGSRRTETPTPPTTPPPSPAAPASSFTSTSAASTTSVPGSTTTTVGGGSGSATISQYVYSGANPVECNAPTFVD